MSTELIEQAILILSKIEASAAHAQKLIEQGNMDALPRLYAELHVCRAWMAELSEIEEKTNNILAAPCQSLESQDGNRIAQFNIDRILASGQALNQNVGLLRMVELIENVLHASRRAGRELSGFLSELKQVA